MTRASVLRLLPTSGVALVTASLLLSPGYAQMSGGYTIDPNGTGNRNFTTFDAATKQLFIEGQNGPVTLSVLPGTYNESWLVLPSNQSSTNTLTIKALLPGQAKLTTPGDTIVVFFPKLTASFDVGYVTLEGLVFDSNQIAGHTILFGKGNHDHSIKDCQFNQGLIGPSNRGMIDAESGCNDIEITGCTFDTSPTPNSAYAIYTQGTPGMNIHHNEFIFNGGLTYGISLWNSNAGRSLIYNNLFRGSLRNISSARALRINVSGYQIDIINNTFDVDLQDAAAWLVETGGLASNRHNRFVNNIFNVRGGGGGIRIVSATTPIETDYNLYNIASGNIGWFNSITETTLASWSAAIAGVAQNSRSDANSATGNPLFIAPTDWHVAPASPAVGLGVAAHGTFGSLQVTDDLDGLLRGTVFDAGSYEVSGFELYGMGCPGTASKVPALNFGGDMAPSSSFSVELADGLGSAPAFIAIGLARTSVPFGSCTLLNSAQIVLGGLMTNAQGQISLPFSIPASAPVTGTPLHFQWAVADVNGGAFGLALSNGGSAKL